MEGGTQDAVFRAFATGFFEVVEALMGQTVEHEVGRAVSLTPDNLREALAQFPVIIRGAVGGQALCAVLLTVKEASWMGGTVFGHSGRPEGRLADHDLNALRELGGHALKGGMDRLAERTGVAVALKETQASVGGPSEGETVYLAFQEAGALTTVRFQVTADTEEAVLILSEELWRQGQADIDRLDSGSSKLPAEAQRPAAVIGQTYPGKEQGMTTEPERTPRVPGATSRDGASNLDMILDIRLVVRARLGRIEMPINEILGLGPGSIVEVGRMLDEPVDLLVNDKLIARGDVVVVDEKFGLRITEIVSPRERIESLR